VVLASKPERDTPQLEARKVGGKFAAVVELMCAKAANNKTFKRRNPLTPKKKVWQSWQRTAARAAVAG
jgi:hypothetical protein